MRPVWLRVFLLPACVMLVSCVERPADETPEAASLDFQQYPVNELRTFLRGARGAWQHTTDEARGVAPPPQQLELPPDSLVYDFPPAENFTAYDMTLFETMARRRSVRSFSSDALSMKQLGFLLWSAQGVTASLRFGDEPKVYLRTSPSAGALYPMETFVFVRNVDNLEAGLYRYLPLSHQLLVVRIGEEVLDELVDAHFGSEMIREAAVVLALATVPYRTEWRYAHLSHRMIAMEAGHILQNVLLAAVAIDAGACAVAAYHQDALDTLLGFDGEDAFAMYLAAIGFPGDDASP